MYELLLSPFWFNWQFVPRDTPGWVGTMTFYRLDAFPVTHPAVTKHWGGGILDARSTP